MNLPEPYIYCNPISSGPLSSSVLARDSKTGNLHLIKIINKSQFNPNYTIDNFKSYIEKIKALKSPFVVPYQEIIEDQSHLYLVRGYIEGVSLYDIIRFNRPIHNQNLIYAHWKILVRTVVHLHQNHIFPLFLKISNIFFMDNKGILLTDLYPVPEITEKFCKENFYSVALLAPEFFTPESEKLRAQWSDTWSLGALLLTMLNGCFPWQNVDQLTNLKFNYIVPNEIRRTIEISLLIEPEQRIQCYKLLNARPRHSDVDPKRPTCIADILMRKNRYLSKSAKLKPKLPSKIFTNSGSFHC